MRTTGFRFTASEERLMTLIQEEGNRADVEQDEMLFTETDDREAMLCGS